MSAEQHNPAVPPSQPTEITPLQSRAIWVMLSATFIAILNETTMGVAIPHLITDLGTTAVGAQWLTTAFMLTMAIVIPTSGYLLQRFSTRTMFTAAMALFTAGTLIAVIAPNLSVLVVARVVQASGTAIMFPLLMTTIMTVVPPASRGRMMGRVSLVMAFAPAIGPVLSGLILDTLGWRWVFGIVFPIALIALIIGTKLVPSVGEHARTPFDLVSVILSAFGFGGIVYGLSQIGQSTAGSGALTLWVPLAVGAVGIALFIWRQLTLQRDDAAMLDLRVFSSLNFTLSVSQFGVLSFAFFGAITVLPLYLQRIHGLSALDSGMILLPGSLAMGFAGPLIGRIYDRFGTRVLLVPGAIAATAVLWFYTTISETTAIWLLIVSQTVLSLALAASFTPLSTAALASLRPHLYSHGSAVLGTVQQVAGAAGVALLITIMSSVSSSTGGGPEAITAEGTQRAFLIAAIVAIPLIVGACFIRKPDEVAVETASA